MENSNPSTSKQAKSYQDEVWVSTWKRRSAGLWGGVVTGAGIGAIIGSLSCLAPLALGVIGVSSLLPMMGVIVPAMIIAGIGMGMAVFTAVGAPAGATAHGLKVQDERNRETEAKSISLPAQEKPKRNWDWRVAIPAFAAAAAVGALFVSTGGFGAVFAATVGPSLATALGSAELAATVMPSITIAAFGLYGSLFSFNMPKFSNQITNFMGTFLSGKIFDGEEPSQARSMEKTPDAPALGFKKPTLELEVGFQSDKGIKTVVAPIGQYAGKEGGMHTRRLAQQQFNAMDTRNSIPH